MDENGNSLNFNGMRKIINGDTGGEEQQKEKKKDVEEEKSEQIKLQVKASTEI